MKKLLLLITAIAVALGASAKIDASQCLKCAVAADKQLKAPQKTDADGYELKFCDVIASWYYTYQANNVSYRCFLYINEDIATKLAGNKITDITFSCAILLASGGQLSGSVFVAETDYDNPENVTECTIVNGYDASTRSATPQTVTLAEPYEIKAGQGFFFGYEVIKCKFSRTAGADYPVGIDGLAPNGFSGYVSMRNAMNKHLGDVDMAKDLGTNLFLSAKTVGEVHGLENVFMINGASLGTFTLPVVEKGADNNVLVGVRNYGSNALTSVEYHYDVNGTVTDVATSELNVAAFAEETFQVPAPAAALADGRNSVKFVVDKVNGETVGSEFDLVCYYVDPAKAYPRKFVVEEGTGTWCGFCPRGIVGMETMAEKYPETFIPIAVHSGDAMETSSYADFINMYFDGFPSCIVNRDPIFNGDPSARDLEYYYGLWESQKAFANVDLSVAYGDGTFEATANTTFAYDESDASYRLAFVITEDGITGTQQNYYAGGDYGPLPGWSDAGESVEWTYKDTAMDIFKAFGLDNSVPAAISGGVANEFVITFKSNKVKKVENTYVVALLLDGQTGTILNAARVAAADYKAYSAVSDIIADADNAPVRYFDLTGRSIAKPVSGQLVIKVTGTKAEKILVK